MNDIIELINKHTKYKSDQILKCDHFYFGYTNNSYAIELNDHNKIFAKYSISKSINKIDEGKIYKLYLPDILIYSNNNGLLITHWIETCHDLKRENVLNLLINEINKFHKIEVGNHLQTFNYYEYDNLLDKFSTNNELYHNLVKKWCIGDMVTSHNDINDKNYIVTNENDTYRVNLIDFEWTTKNFAWWDYINYLAEQTIYEKEIWLKWMKYIPGSNSLNDIYEMLFIRWWYCYGWSISEKNILPNMKEYSDKCLCNIDVIIKNLNN